MRTRPFDPLLPLLRRCNAVLPSSALLLLGAGTALAAAPSPPVDLAEPPAAAQKHPSGLRYVVLVEPTTEESPDENDVAFLRFTGWTPGGAVIATNEDQEAPSPMRLEEVYAGWRIAVTDMKVGERRRIWIPAELGPRDPAGNPKGDAVFEVSLEGIGRLMDFSPEWREPPADAVRTASWASYVVLKEGEGEPAARDSVALVAYTGWTSSDGKVFDSTSLRARPTAFPLDKVMPSFADAVVGMKPGERRRIWIPGNVANGEWVNSPQGDLLFDVQLLRLVELPISDGPPPAASGS